MPKSIRQGCGLLLTAAVVAGCAGGSNSAAGGAQTVMVAAAAKSEAASTFHISATETMKSVSGTPLLDISSASFSGDVDLSTSSASMTATLVGPPPKSGGAPQKFSLAVIQIGNDSWNSTSGLDALFPTSVPPGHWVKDTSSSPVSQFPNPQTLFNLLKSKATKVRSLGSATVDGVRCDEYQLTGPSNLLDAVGGNSDPSTTTGPVSLQVWVDKSNLVRRLATTVEENMGDPGQVESVAMSLDFSDYGEAVHIQPPPANLVVPST